MIGSDDWDGFGPDQFQTQPGCFVGDGSWFACLSGIGIVQSLGRRICRRKRRDQNSTTKQNGQGSAHGIDFFGAAFGFVDGMGYMVSVLRIVRSFIESRPDAKRGIAQPAAKPWRCVSRIAS